LEDYERLPRDYDKEVHDNLYHTHICECFVFVIVHIPGRDPLRLVATNRWTPRRLETPYFIDAWEDNDNDDAQDFVLVNLDKHAGSIKKCAVWRPKPPLENETREGSSLDTPKIRWSTTHAKSEMFEDPCDDDSDEDDFGVDNDFSDDDGSEG